MRLKYLPNQLGARSREAALDGTFMDEEPCACCGGSMSEPERPWFDDVYASLPTAVSDALAPFNAGRPVASLADWAATIRRATGGVVTVDELCLVHDDSPHHAIMDGTRYDFACCIDAVILAAIEERAVRVATRSPDGDDIFLLVDSDGDVRANPIDTVFSFGVDTRVEPADPPTLADAYRAICPYVKAFPSVEEYDRWSAETHVPTVSFSGETVTELARRLARPVDSE